MTGATAAASDVLAEPVAGAQSALDFQRSYWNMLSKSPGLRPVIDPADRAGDKNERIDQRHRTQFRDFLRRCGVERVGAVLDFGCGIGRHHDLLASLADRYVGVDISAGMLARAPGETHLIAGAHLPFDDATFELIVTFWVLQHVVADQTLEEIVTEFRRCVAPGGTVILCERSLGTIVEPGKPAAYLRGRSPLEYERLFAAHGFRLRQRRRLTYGSRWRTILSRARSERMRTGEHFYAFAA